MASQTMERAYCSCTLPIMSSKIILHIIMEKMESFLNHMPVITILLEMKYMEMQTVEF